MLFKYFTEGKLERTGTGSVTEGIGQGRLTDNLAGARVDSALHIPDSESVEMVCGLCEALLLLCMSPMIGRQ